MDAGYKISIKFKRKLFYTIIKYYRLALKISLLRKLICFRNIPKSISVRNYRVLRKFMNSLFTVFIFYFSFIYLNLNKGMFYS